MEYFDESVLKDPVITSKMDKETILKKICKRHLFIVYEFGKMVGGLLAKKKSKKTGRALESAFKKQFGFELTISLKKAGVLPLPIYKEKKAA